MNLAILDSSTGTVHLIKARGKNADRAIERFANSHPQFRLNDCDWMEFKAILFHCQAKEVVIDVLGGVAEVRSAPFGVDVRIVDHDHP